MIEIYIVEVKNSFNKEWLHLKSYFIKDEIYDEQSAYKAVLKYKKEVQGLWDKSRIRHAVLLYIDKK